MRSFLVLLILGVTLSGCGVGQAGQREVLTLRVPSMTCPTGCFPIVKETLEQQEGVESVELYPQAKPDAIDDRRVRVSVKGAFDADKAIAALAAEGYDGATVEASP